MDHAAYHVVYVDTRISRGLDGTHIHKSGSSREELHEHQNDRWGERDPEYLQIVSSESEEVYNNLRNILLVFNGGMR